MFKFFQVVLYSFFLIVVISCGGGSSSTDNATPSDNEETNNAQLGPMQGQILLGPIVGATVEIYPASALDLPAICTTTSSDQDAPNGPGVINLSTCSIDPDILYYLIVFGGEDIDVDDNGVLDNVPTPKQGALHALITGQEIIDGNWRINILTELAYQNALDILISNPDSTKLLDKRDNTANILLSADLNDDGVIDGFDLSQFLPQDHFDTLINPDNDLISSILASIHSGNSVDTTELSRQYLLAAVGHLNYDNSYFSGFINLDYIYDSGLLYMAGTTWDNSSTIVDNVLSIRIYDPSNSDNISLMGSLDITELNTDLLASGFELKKSGNYLYIATGSSGLVIVDVSNPESPEYITTYQNMTSVDSIEIGGSYAYISTYLGDISILDISNPSSPGFVASVAMNAFDIIYRENRLYVYGAGVSILDITDLSNISVTDNLVFPSGSGRSIQLDGNYLFVPSSLDGQFIRVFDISDESAITQIHEIPVSGYVSDIFIEDNLLFASMPLDSGYVINTYEIKNTGELKLIDSRSGLNTGRIAVGGNNLFLTSVKELNMYNKDTLNQAATNVANITTINEARLVKTVDGLSYVADSTRLNIYDTNNPLTDVKELGSIQLIDQIEDFQIIGNYAYIANASEGISIIDISDPANPSFVANNNSYNYSEPDVSYSTGSIAVQGNYAYTSIDNLGKLIVFDISNPELPVPVGDQLDIDSFIFSFIINNNLLYGLGNNGLEVINIQDPLNISSLGQSFIFASDMVINNNIGYMSRLDGGIYTLDLLNNNNPVIVGQAEGLGNGKAISIINNIAYVANAFGYIGVYDVIDTSNPVYITQYKVNGIVSDVSAEEDFIFATNGLGLVVENAVKNLSNIN